MRSYYVDVIDGDEFLCDTMGGGIHSFDEAKGEAVSALADLIRIRMPDNDVVAVSISVRDDDGHTVFTASAGCVAHPTREQSD